MCFSVTLSFLSSLPSRSPLKMWEQNNDNIIIFTWYKIIKINNKVEVEQKWSNRCEIIITIKKKCLNKNVYSSTINNKSTKLEAQITMETHTIVVALYNHRLQSTSKKKFSLWSGQNARLWKYRFGLELHKFGLSDGLIKVEFRLGTALHEKRRTPH